MRSVAGGVEASVPASEAGPTLVLGGFVVFGGVSVRARPAPGV
jgi:hypothetical protein